MKKSHLLAMVFVFAFASTGRADVIFSGADLGVLPASPSGTNSSAAAASFDTAAALLGNVSIITFESAPVGSFTSLTVAPGVTISGSNADGNHQTINNTPDAAFPSLDGYNTTSGGANFVELTGGTLVFTFATPTQFFGAFLSGVQDFTTDTITFNDGSSQTIDVPETGTSGSIGELAFVGFTDAGKSISSITINAGSLAAGFDDIGVDDVRYQSVPSGVPEPGSVALLLTICLLALAPLVRRLQGTRV
jgi:hypothetical protein